MARRRLWSGRAAAMGLLAAVGAGVSVADCTTSFVLGGGGGGGGGRGGAGGATGGSSGATSTSSSTTSTSSSATSGGACDSDGGIPATGVVWAERFGGSANQVAYALALDGQGQLAIAGVFAPPTDFGGTTLDGSGDWTTFLAKYGTDGGPVWAREFPNSAQPWAMGLVLDDAGTAFLAGAAQHLSILDAGVVNGAFAARFDATGEPVWMSAGGSGDARAIALDSHGDVVVTGRFSGAAPFGCGDATSAAGDVFVAKLAGADGKCLWSRSLGGSGTTDASGWGIAVGVKGGPAADEVFVTGRFAGTLANCAGTPSSQGGPNAFVARLHGADGTCSAARRLGDAPEQTGRSIAVSGGSVVIAGDSTGGLDLGQGSVWSGIFVAKLDAMDFHTVWGEPLGLADTSSDDTGHPRSVRVAVDPQQNVLLTGTFVPCAPVGTGNNVRDLFVEKRDSNGALLWRDIFGARDGNDQVGYGIAGDDAGVFLAGGFSVAVAFTPDAGLTAINGRDILLVRLQP